MYVDKLLQFTTAILSPGERVSVCLCLLQAAAVIQARIYFRTMASLQTMNGYKFLVASPQANKTLPSTTPSSRESDPHRLPVPAVKVTRSPQCRHSEPVAS